MGDSANVVGFSSVPDGSEVHAVLSADLLGIRPVTLVMEVLVIGLGSLSLADELSLSIAVSRGPFSLNTRLSAVLRLVGFRRFAWGPEMSSGREFPFAFFLQVIGTNPEVLFGLTSSNAQDGVHLATALGVSEITAPSDAELSSLSPGSPEVVEGELPASSYEDLGVHPGLCDWLLALNSLANVSFAVFAVSGVPFATRRVDVHFSAANLLGGSSEPFPAHH